MHETRQLKQLGHYRIERLIGVGTSGAVYRAVDRRNHTRVALKVLHEHLTHDQIVRERFEREAQVAAILRSPYTTRTLDFGRQGDFLYLVLELVDGLTLQQALGFRTFSPNAAILIGVRVARALREAEAQGIVHRDIKPANVMLTKSGEVKVTDFGIAGDRAGLDLTTHGAFLGTPFYAAPETWTGTFDQRSDIYALGATLYHLIAGTPPFEGNLMQVVHQKQRDEVDWSPIGSEGDPLVGLLSRCLKADPDERYQSAADVEAALSALIRPGSSLAGEGEITLDGEATHILAESIRRPAGIPGRLMSPSLFVTLIVAVVLLTLPSAAASPTPIDYVVTRAFGQFGAGPGDLNLPADVAIDAGGRIVVADSGNNRIQVFSAEGDYLDEWGSKGSELGQFDQPNDLAIDSHGYIYVTDIGNNRVQKFTGAGEFVFQLSSGGANPGQLSQPVGVVVDSSDNLYIADSGNYRIQKFSPDGRLLTGWGGYGNAQGQFLQPSGLAVADDGDVIVTDFEGQRVQVFSSDGNFEEEWGEAGSGPGQFANPGAAATDRLGRIFITDWDNDRVQVFDEHGRYLTEWGSRGVAVGQFEQPSSIALTADLRAYVADFANHRIQEFEPVPNIK